MTESIKDQVRTVIIEHLEVDAALLDQDASFTKDLGLDSLDAMDLMLAIDESCHVRIPQEAMIEIDTLSQLVAAVEKYQEGNRNKNT